MEHDLDGTWTFGTAKLVHKRGKFFLHIPVTQAMNEPAAHNIERIVGVDMGINFIAVSYDSQGTTAFFHGRRVKNQRSKYKRLRKRLQQVGTASARRAIKRIGQRENRYMTDVNHRISKALVDRYGANTLFVVEDLTGISQVTERVRIRDRYKGRVMVVLLTSSDDRVQSHSFRRQGDRSEPRIHVSEVPEVPAYEQSEPRQEKAPLL